MRSAWSHTGLNLMTQFKSRRWCWAFVSLAYNGTTIAVAQAAGLMQTSAFQTFTDSWSYRFINTMYQRWCCVFCGPFCHPSCLVVFWAAVATVTVNVCLAGALLVVAFGRVGSPSSFSSVFPQQWANPLSSTPTRRLSWEIWGEKAKGNSENN